MRATKRSTMKEVKRFMEHNVMHVFGASKAVVSNNAA